MIKIENVEIVGWEAAIRGMRNPMNSWEKSDSERNIRFYKLLRTIFHICEIAGFELKGRVTIRDRKTGRIWS